MLDDLQDSSTPKAQKDYWQIVRRRRWYFLAPFFVGWIVVAAFSYLLPPSYRSDALILVAQPSVPADVVSLNVKDDFAERLRSITQQTLSRARLQRIIDEFHLYPTKRNTLSPERLVERMRRDIEIYPLPVESIASNSGEDPEQVARKALTTPSGKATDAIGFRVSYAAPKPELAKQVADQLVSLFIEENRRARQQESEVTTNFLAGQVENARDSLQAQQQRIQEFKHRYLGELPEQKESNLQILATLHSRLEAANSDLTRAEEQKLYLDSLLGQYRTLQSAMQPSSNPNAKSPADLDKELSRLQGQLADLSGYYTANYPDVKRLREQIAEAQRLKEKAEAEAAKHQSDADPASAAVSVPRPTSYQDLQAMTPMLQIESQLKSNKQQIEDDRQAMVLLNKDIQQYQDRLNGTPMRQQELETLTKDHDQARIAYDSLVAKSTQSQLATDLEHRNQGQQYVLLTSPRLPRSPFSPDRFMWNLVGLGIGFGLGFLITAGVEVLDKRIYSDKEVKALVAAPVLVEIPSVTTEADNKGRSQRTIYEWCAASAMIAIMAGESLLSYLFYYRNG